MQEDGLNIENLEDLKKYHILENKSPRPCADRLDGVLHTCYIWLNTHQLSQIKKVYDGITALINEDDIPKIGFKDQKTANEFVNMVFTYAKELQGNTDDFIMKYISKIIKFTFEKKLVSLENFYIIKESNLCEYFKKKFSLLRAFLKK